MKRKIKILNSFLLFFFIVPIYADYILTDKQYEAVLEQLKRDQQIIKNNNIRWDKLKKSKPKITYEIIDDQVVIQSIEIPVYNTKPIVYKVKFKVEPEKDPLKYFPLTLQLCGILETIAITDFKVGLQLFSLAPIKIIVLRNLGINILAGIKSSGISISYRLPKPLKNTSIHIYTGFSYTEVREVFGVGISLNF